MLDELHVKDVALIRDATLVPSRHLTVVTGETGAGKTALVSALALLAGARADAGAVREGADALQVEGRFMLDHTQGSRADMDAQDTAGAQAGEVVVARQLTSDGRSRVHINGAMASVGQLAEGVGASIDLCGQHEHQRLMQVANHREMLDAWAIERTLPALEAYAGAFANAARAQKELDEFRSAGQHSQEALEQARFALRRIDEVSPAEGEYDELRAALARTTLVIDCNSQ